jgi:hypothetical protein
MLLRRALQGASLEPGNKHQNFTAPGKIFVFIAGKERGKEEKEMEKEEKRREKRKRKNKRKDERIKNKIALSTRDVASQDCRLQQIFHECVVLSPHLSLQASLLSLN